MCCASLLETVTGKTGTDALFPTFSTNEIGKRLVSPPSFPIDQIEILCVLRGSTQEADGALNGRYRASRYFKLNTIATMAKTIGQKMLASGPTVPPVSQRGPLNDALRRFWEGSKPLFGTPYKNV